MTKKIFLISTILLFTINIFSQKIEIPTKKTGLKVVALIDLLQHGQLLITQRNNKESYFATLISNEMEMKWETECPFEDDNGPRAANLFTFLHNDKTIFIINQSKHNYYSVLDIETGELKEEVLIKGTSELRKGEFFVSKDKLYMSNIFGNQLKIYEIRKESLIPKCEIYPPALTKAVKNTSLQMLKIQNDTIYSFQSLPDANHRKLHIIFYKHKMNGVLIDTIHNTLEIKKYYAFAFNSDKDMNCQYIFDYKGNFYMFGNLAPSLSEDFGQFPASNDSRGFWWVRFDDSLHSKDFFMYPFKSIFKKSDEIIIDREKYWGVKADADSGFFVNMNLIPGGIYTGNLTFYVNNRGYLKWFTNTDNKDNFMRYTGVITRQYIRKSDMYVLNDQWNFYSTHHFGKLVYNNFQSNYTKQIVERAAEYTEDSQKSELAFTIINKNGFAILAQYYFKKNKVLTLEIIK